MKLRLYVQSNSPFKGTVSLIPSDPLCKDGNARFTTVPLKALSDQVPSISLLYYPIKT